MTKHPTEVVASDSRFTAIFALNDNNAIGVMAAAHALDLSVPDDLSLIGYNDIGLNHPARHVRTGHGGHFVHATPAGAQAP